MPLSGTGLNNQESESTIDFAQLKIDEMVRNRKVVLIELAALSPNKEFYEFYSKKTSAELVKRQYNAVVVEIDISAVTDDCLAQRIISFLLHDMSASLKPSTFHFSRALGLKKVLSKTSFLQKDYSDFLDDFQSTTTVLDELGDPTIKAFISVFLQYCKFIDTADNPFDNDIWDLSLFVLTPEQKNPARNVAHLNFGNIKDKSNRALVKKYIRYLLENSNLSVSTIEGKLKSIQQSLNLIDVAYLSWNSEIAEEYVAKLKEKYSKPREVGHKLAHLEAFTGYLVIHDYLSDSPIKQYHELASQGVYQYKTTAPDEFVIVQIFNALGKIEDVRLILFFLLVYCTGMRGSEASAINADCLEKRDGGYFVRYYSMKMRKEVANVIPKALFEMIADYKKDFSIQTGYLFPSTKKGRPMQNSTIIEKLCDEFKRVGIINPDGTPYRFAPHSFRHLIAVKMREQEIPFQFIQEQLHHRSPEMTLAYLEYVDRKKLKKMDAYINVHGQEAPPVSDVKFTADEAYAEYMRSFINAQMLPNGVCARPVKLGKCPHGNSCLTCPEFRTSLCDLPVHEKQLKQTEKYIDIAKANGWAPQVESNMAVKESLTAIISKLKSLEDTYAE